MTGLNEDLLLEYLVENVSKDLAKQYPVKAVLALDYCYKEGENIPQDFLSDMAAKIINKRINFSSKSLKIDESNIIDCFFIESYESLLSDRIKSLAKSAKTTKDFKEIVIIDFLSKKVSNCQRILNSDNNLGSKVLSLARAYKDSVLENKSSKDYDQFRELSLIVNAELKKSFDAGIAKNLQKIKNDLDGRLAAYSKHQGKMLVHEIQNLIVSMRNSIDHKFRDYLFNVDQDYRKVKSSFENSVWDNEKRINKLIGLKSEIGGVKQKYQLVLFKEGINRCKDLECQVQRTIDKHYDIRYAEEEFKSIKTELSDYYSEVDSIFSVSISPLSMTRLNNIYLRLEGLAIRKFPGYIPNGWQEDYYLRLGKIMQYIKQKCTKRVACLLDQNAKCRQKVDSAFFSWRTKKFVEELEEYNTELKVWSKCRAI